MNLHVDVELEVSVRVSGKGFVAICVFALIVAGAIHSSNEAKKLEELRESDPAAYLAILQTKDETKWMLELKELAPEDYKVELTELIAETRAIPAEEIGKNLTAYEKLVTLEPENEQFQQRVDHYQAELDQLLAEQERCSSSRKSDAYIYSKSLVRRQLRAPRTAKFGSYGQTNISVYRDCVFVIQGHVDAQNGFGALIRTHYEVRLKGTESGWTVTRIDM